VPCLVASRHEPRASGRDGTLLLGIKGVDDPFELLELLRRQRRRFLMLQLLRLLLLLYQCMMLQLLLLLWYRCTILRLLLLLL
jgi:hypothetical protein